MRMAGFAMVPPAPFEGEVCVAGAWVIPQALSGDGFLFVQTSLPERRVGVSLPAQASPPSTIVDACLAGPQLCAW